MAFNYMNYYWSYCCSIVVGLFFLPFLSSRLLEDQRDIRPYIETQLTLTSPGTPSRK
jgi:hypothetical protein